jgi:spore maturation protein CgeB
MRLLISGSLKNPNTIGSFITRNFSDSLEWDFLTFPDAYATLLSSKYYRIINRIWPLLLARKMDKIFLKQVEAYKPTVIVVFKGMEISSWSLRRIRKKGVKLVNYNFDHPFDFFSRGTGNKFVKEAIPYYDLHISYSSVIAAELARRYNVRTAWIPFGFHITQTQYDAVIRERREEIRRVCFVGNPDQWRVELLGKLIRDGVAVDLYGFGWEKFFNNSELLKIHPPRKAHSYWEDPDEFWNVLRQYRVQLNFFRPHNEGSHNLRTFEVPGVGGILLTPASKEQGSFFEEGKEIFFYSDYETLLSQCKWLLDRDASWIEDARSAARNKSVTMDYSYKRRTDDLLHLIGNL